MGGIPVLLSLVKAAVGLMAANPQSNSLPPATVTEMQLVCTALTRMAEHDECSSHIRACNGVTLLGKLLLVQAPAPKGGCCAPFACMRACLATRLGRAEKAACRASASAERWTAMRTWVARRQARCYYCVGFPAGTLLLLLAGLAAWVGAPCPWPTPFLSAHPFLCRTGAACVPVLPPCCM